MQQIDTMICRMSWFNIFKDKSAGKQEAKTLLIFPIDKNINK